MKKLFYALVLVGAAVFSSCNNSSTPTTDTTKLWPAGEDDSRLAGYINKSGKMVIVANYSTACFFSCGWAQVTDGSEVMFINSSGKRAKTPYADVYDPFFYNNRLTFTDDKLQGKFDNDFNIVVRANYASLGVTSDNGYCSFMEDGETLFGYMDKNGKIVIEDQFDYATPFDKGIAVVGERKNGEMRYGVINTKGNYIIELGKKSLGNLGESRIRFLNSNDKYGMMDKKGEIIIDGYSSIDPFSCGLAMVTKGDKSGYINTKGDEVIELRYSEAMAFSDNVAWVKGTSENARYELIDKSGEQLFKLKEAEAPAFPQGYYHNGLCLIYNSDKKEYRYIDKEGEVIYKWGDDGAKPMAPQYTLREMGILSMEGTEYAPLFMDMINELKSR